MRKPGSYVSEKGKPPAPNKKDEAMAARKERGEVADVAAKRAAQQAKEVSDAVQ